MRTGLRLAPRFAPLMEPPLKAARGPAGGLASRAAAAVDAPPPPAAAGDGDREAARLKKAAAAAPPPLRPPSLPTDPAAWEAGAVLLVDKPRTWTSFDVCAKLRGALAPALGVRPGKLKVGHAGTLDPMATGLLIVCVGRATKAVDAFMAQEKEYTGVLRLGEATPSHDADSAVAATAPWAHVDDAALAAAAAGLTGRLQQTPPMFSAVRVGGKRLYEVAREGREVERAARAVEVAAFEVSRAAPGAQDAAFRVRCSKGTYVRVLAADLGAAVGSAAHLTALRREAIGPHRVDDAWQVPELVEQINALRRRRQGQRAGEEAAGGAAEAGEG